MKELHPLPDEADVFEEDALARERCLWSDKFGGHACQSGHCGNHRNANCAKERHSHREDEERDARREVEIRKAVHHTIDFPDNRGEKLRSAEESQNAAQDGC